MKARLAYISQQLNIIRRVAPKNSAKFFWGGVVAVVGVALLFKEILAALPNPVAWADKTDSPLIYWIVNWGYHILFEMKQPLSFWDANSFYPHKMTLAYSDSILSIQAFFAPLRLLGVEPLNALYLSLAGICILGFCFTQYGLYRIGNFTIAEVLFISFAAHFGLSMVSFFYHYQLFGFQVAPAFFIFIYLYLRDFQLGDLVIALSLFAVGVLFAIYLAPMLFILGLLAGIPVVIIRWRKIGFGGLIRAIGFWSPLIAAGFALVLYQIQFKPYFEIEGSFPGQLLDDKIVYSADLSSLLGGISPFSKWYGSFSQNIYGNWEYWYFPGFILLGVSLLFLITIVTNRVRRKECLSRDIDRDFLLFLSIVFISSLVLSWGPFYKPAPIIRLPYYYLSFITFGLKNIRAPGRFGMFIGLPLAVFSVYGARLLIQGQFKRQVAVSILLILLVVESWTTFPTYPFKVDPDGVYSRVSKEISPGTPLLELPVVGKGATDEIRHINTLKIATDHLIGSTLHWGRLVDGYGSQTTKDYIELLYFDIVVQNGLRNPMFILRFAKRKGISYLLIHLNDYNSSAREKWVQILDDLDAGIIFQQGDTILVRLKMDSIY
jgi:hypothetical protein